MEKKTPFNVAYLIFAIVAVLILQNLWVSLRAIEPMAYSEFVAQLKSGNVDEIAVAANVIQGTLKSPLADGRKQFVTTRVDPDLARDLEQYNVKFSGVIENTFLKDLLGWGSCRRCCSSASGSS